MTNSLVTSGLHRGKCLIHSQFGGPVESGNRAQRQRLRHLGHGNCPRRPLPLVLKSQATPLYWR